MSCPIPPPATAGTKHDRPTPASDEAPRTGEDDLVRRPDATGTDRSTAPSAPPRPTSGTPSPRAAVLAGLGTYVPPRVVTNDELAARLDTSDSWIRTRIGISTRRVADGEATVDLAVSAGRRALAAAGPIDIRAVVLVTTSADRLCPAGAPEVASRLGLGTVLAFDLASGCSGFVYGLAVAASLITSAVTEPGGVLVVASDVFTALTAPDDRLTAVIFGDGAGAVVLRAGEAGEPGALGPFDLGSDGSQADILHVPGGGTRDKKTRGSGGPVRTPPYLIMDGPAVKRLAVDGMVRSARRAANASGRSIDDIDLVAAHQANQRILDAVARELGLRPHQMLTNIGHVGNTASASIPLLLADSAVAGLLTPGRRVLLSAFGAGLAWGSTTLVWPDICVVVGA
ncbi:beta-ketoacyl-ACP synthase 3 [Streptomyces sp. NPDC090303]|uniref:beta-ketoacyl-ACP synthase 3 n=1 Tax=Streptomyces sp. NPDC090303 TaxID=3365960 RepID=UPI00382996A9